MDTWGPIKQATRKNVSWEPGCQVLYKIVRYLLSENGKTWRKYPRTLSPLFPPLKSAWNKRPFLFDYILSVKSQTWCRTRIRLSFRISINGKGHKTWQEAEDGKRGRWGDISSSEEDVDKETFSQIKKWLKEMEKKRVEDSSCVEVRPVEALTWICRRFFHSWKVLFHGDSRIASNLIVVRKTSVLMCPSNVSN